MKENCRVASLEMVPFNESRFLFVWVKKLQTDQTAF